MKIRFCLVFLCMLFIASMVLPISKSQIDTVTVKITKITRTFGLPAYEDYLEIYVYSIPHADSADFSVIAPDGNEYSMGGGGLALTPDEPSWGRRFGDYPLTQPGAYRFKVVAHKSGYLSGEDTLYAELSSWKQHQSLETAYDSLQNSYDSLNSQFGNLNRDLNNVRQLFNIFMITTLIFVGVSIVATSLYLRTRTRVKTN